MNTFKERVSSRKFVLQILNFIASTIVVGALVCVVYIRNWENQVLPILQTYFSFLAVNGGLYIAGNVAESLKELFKGKKDRNA